MPESAVVDAGIVLLGWAGFIRLARAGLCRVVHWTNERTDEGTDH